MRTVTWLERAARTELSDSFCARNGAVYEGVRSEVLDEGDVERNGSAIRVLGPFQRLGTEAHNNLVVVRG